MIGTPNGLLKNVGKYLLVPWFIGSNDQVRSVPFGGKMHGKSRQFVTISAEVTPNGGEK